jgi:hypothetical protein
MVSSRVGGMSLIEDFLDWVCFEWWRKGLSFDLFWLDRGKFFQLLDL